MGQPRRGLVQIQFWPTTSQPSAAPLWLHQSLRSLLCLRGDSIPPKSVSTDEDGTEIPLTCPPSFCLAQIDPTAEKAQGPAAVRPNHSRRLTDSPAGSISPPRRVEEDGGSSSLQRLWTFFGFAPRCWSSPRGGLSMRANCSDHSVEQWPTSRASTNHHYQQRHIIISLDHRHWALPRGAKRKVVESGRGRDRWLAMVGDDDDDHHHHHHHHQHHPIVGTKTIEE
uniref:Uncharacterized protein n=1 Tax=Globodera rostochiensis TaxID=31243 RepID=A0A914ICG8_GLORO